MKISEWLDEFDSHGVYDNEALTADFIEKTGEKPCWPTHTAAAELKAMRDRGLGGWMKLGDQERLLANGWEMAEALARHYVPGFSTGWVQGRGSRFRLALEAIRQAGH